MSLATDNDCAKYQLDRALTPNYNRVLVFQLFKCSTFDPCIVYPSFGYSGISVYKIVLVFQTPGLSENVSHDLCIDSLKNAG